MVTTDQPEQNSACGSTGIGGINEADILVGWLLPPQTNRVLLSWFLEIHGVRRSHHPEALYNLKLRALKGALSRRLNNESHKIS